ncbi:hypothetical protein WL29_22335 [Burkholderia ubonensis]|uniref:Uncharacterized protein n=1 Tax=Burkholderia ubonensis TaxID=101571 RepID=A0A119HFL6_9BURK|nr:hypothetical protein WL29_22335 [Burkholderia ubonensis]
MSLASSRAAKQHGCVLQTLELRQVVGRDLEMMACVGVELVQRQAPCLQLLTGELEAENGLRKFRGPFTWLP